YCIPENRATHRAACAIRLDPALWSPAGALREEPTLGNEVISLPSEVSLVADQHNLVAVLDATQAMVRGLDGTIRYWSTGAERLYGWSRADAVGKVSHIL